MTVEIDLGQQIKVFHPTGDPSEIAWITQMIRDAGWAQTARSMLGLSASGEYGGYSTDGISVIASKDSVSKLQEWHHSHLSMVPALRQRITEMEAERIKLADRLSEANKKLQQLRPRLFLITGPQGSGKSLLAKALADAIVQPTERERIAHNGGKGEPLPKRKPVILDDNVSDHFFLSHGHARGLTLTDDEMATHLIMVVPMKDPSRWQRFQISILKNLGSENTKFFFLDRPLISPDLELITQRMSKIASDSR